MLDCPVGGENLDPGSLGMDGDVNRVRTSMLKSKNGPYDPFQVLYCAALFNVYCMRLTLELRLIFHFFSFQILPVKSLYRPNFFLLNSIG